MVTDKVLLVYLGPIDAFPNLGLHLNLRLNNVWP